MQNNRREFVKKAAAVVAASTVAGTVVSSNLMASTGESMQSDTNNGVVKGMSNKKEILYTKNATWEQYYKNAK